MRVASIREKATQGLREKTPGLGISLQAVKTRPSRVVAFGLFWAWIWLLFQDSERLALSESASFLFTLLYYLPLLFYALGFVAIGLLYQVKHIVPQGPRYERALATFVTAGTLLVVGGFWLYPRSSLLGSICCIFGCLLAGSSAAFLHTEWARLFVSLGARATIISCVFATLIAGVFVIATELLPLTALWLLLAILPGLSARALFHDPAYQASPRHSDAATTVYVPWKLLATAFVQGLSLGLIAVLSSSFADIPAFAATIGYMVGALLILGVVLLFRVDYNAFIYRIGFPIMAAAWLVILAAHSFGALSVGVHAIGYRFVDLAIWSVTIYIIKDKRLPTNWVCAVNTSALMAGQFLGVGLALLPTTRPLQPLQEELCNGYAAVMVLVLFMVALLVFSSKNLKTGWGLVRPSDETVPDDLAEACRTLGAYRKLTNRETDILVYLARGRNRAYICNDLVLAQDTVKTYIRTVYRKLEVHSQQEVISLVEKQMMQYEEKRE